MVYNYTGYFYSCLGQRAERMSCSAQTVAVHTSWFFILGSVWPGLASYFIQISPSCQSGPPPTRECLLTPWPGGYGPQLTLLVPSIEATLPATQNSHHCTTPPQAASSFQCLNISLNFPSI